MNDLQGPRRSALASGVPESVVDWWLGFARVQLEFSQLDETDPASSDAVVAGRFGGRPRLPADVEWNGYPHFVASLDLAALPRDLPGLPLPPDGTLLIFGDVEEGWSTAGASELGCRVLHVPAGTPTAERVPPESPDVADHVREPYPLRYLRRWTLPEENEPAIALDEDHRALFDEHDLGSFASDEFLKDAVFLLGGHSDGVQDDPCVQNSEWRTHDSDDWRLLASWTTGTQPDGYDASLYWIIPREDLEAGRFDRVMLETQMHDSQGSYS
ncbi:DUF1963 domain-containing protein [Umezawaea sp. NPDC059074]|uniref:DUF1963 domain-containing protein n=1 Tax=Umezawaea sp. NPDC059074 TaxID=3346716 RepID=UPI0036B5FEF9